MGGKCEERQGDDVDGVETAMGEEQGQRRLGQPEHGSLVLEFVPNIIAIATNY